MFQFIKYLYYRKYFSEAFEMLDKSRFKKAYDIFIFLYKEKKMDNFYVNLNIGRALTGLKRYKEAREYFFKSFDQFSLNPVPLNGIALTYMKEKKYIWAYRYLSKAVKIDKIHSISNYYMGITLIGLGHPDKAQPYFEKVLCERKDFLYSRIALFIEKKLDLETGNELGEF